MRREIADAKVILVPTMRNEIDRDAIEHLAREFCQAHEEVALPINVHALAEEEGIAILPGDFGDSFDGRIECRREDGRPRFYIFHAAEQATTRPRGRVRFTIAHELGHFVIPTHRKVLLAGTPISSRTDFYSAQVREREADWFAACLLMPREPFLSETKRKNGFLSLKQIGAFAKDRFDTSFTSTAIRYVDLSPEACAAVLSAEGKVLFAAVSDDMKDRGLPWIPRAFHVASGTPTWKAWRGGIASAHEGDVDAEVWFGPEKDGRLFEEAVALSDSGKVLTLLSVAEDEDVDDDD